MDFMQMMMQMNQPMNMDPNFLNLNPEGGQNPNMQSGNPFTGDFSGQNLHPGMYGNMGGGVNGNNKQSFN